MEMDKLKHSYNVAKKMQQIGKKLNLSNEEINDLFIIGLNHDIGYEFSKNGKNHNKIGGDILKNNNYKYYQEIYYHGEVQYEYQSLFLDILNSADMQIDKYGNDVGYDKRLDDIGTRYGFHSNVYKNCQILVNNLKDKY